MTFMFEEISETEISIKENGELVLTFNYSEDTSGSFIHPLWTPNGHVLTTGINGVEQNHPPGLCWTYGAVKNGSSPVPKRSIVGPSHHNLTLTDTDAKFIHTVQWASEETRLKETWEITVYPIQDDVRVLDLTLDLETYAKPIAYENEIGLSYYAVEMEHRKVANANGKIGESEVNGQESEWATLCGITNDNAVGLAILPHIDNGPTLFQAEDMYQGYLSAKTAPFTLNNNENIKLKCRILIYLGDLFTFDISDYYEKYIGNNV